MTNSTNSPIRFPILHSSVYFDVLEAAENHVKSRLNPPDKKQYKTKVESIYPWWFTGAILLALFLVMALSFVVSAGKQAAAMGLILDPLPGKFNHLSSGWADLSITFMLALSELGTILFLVAGGTLTNRVGLIEIGQLRFNPVKWLFRFFAMLCAAYSVVSNTTITALDMVNDAIVLQWLVTLGIPSIVLGLGIMLERIIVDALATRGESQAVFQKAKRDYDAYLENPRLHPSFEAILVDMLFAEMIRVKTYQSIIRYMVEADPRYKGWLVSAEYKTQQQLARLDGNVDAGALPIELPMTQDAPALKGASRSASKGASKKRVDAPKISAMEQAKKWLEEHPNHGMSHRNAARQAGVSESTMLRAMNGEK